MDWAVFSPNHHAAVVALRMHPRPGMNEHAEALKQRTKQFALDVLALTRTLPETDEARTIARQLIRSGTGVGANYRATCRARSRAEFVARVGVALEEADESGFWLEVLTEGRISISNRALELLEEANQLSAILAASSITASESLRRAETRRR